MSAVDTRQKVTLPEAVMRCLEAIAADEQLSPADRIAGAVHLINGWAWYETQQDIDPTQIAIPTAQWHRVCTALAHGPDAVNLGLEFMNYGPSAFD